MSVCHTMAGSRPEVRRSARAMSRSRLIPGKTRTADRIISLQTECRSGASSEHLDAIILNHRIGEKLVGRLPQQLLGEFRITARKLDVEHLALADAFDSIEA